MAEPPKLMRRTNGVVGAVLALPWGPSSSSMALSSIESELELVDMLPRRMPKGTVVLGEVPDKPRVVMERRRRSPAAGFGWTGGKEGPPE